MPPLASRIRPILIWLAVGTAVLVPIVAAAASPLLAWRSAVYIAAGFAGIIAMALMLVQPLLAVGYLPGLTRYAARRTHLWIGTAMVAAVLLHIVGLYVTSPPDVIDALTFDSPTPFSNWGVIAMWALFLVALLVALRNHIGVRPRTWRMIHTALFSVIVPSTVVHAVLIHGTMETLTKVALSAFLIMATLKAIFDLRVWRKRRGRPIAPAIVTPE
ncbi:MAG: ferric reductase [Hyphomicrobiaceae bacterium]